MFVIYHYETILGKCALLFDQVVPSKRLAEDWIKHFGKDGKHYKFEKVGYYFGERTW